MSKSKLKKWLDFLLAMTEKEIKARYKKAVFGFLWVILNPVLQMLIMGFIFQFFVPVKVDNYFLFLFSGLLAWNFFNMTVLKNTPTFINERSLIAKAKFPREVIVLSIILSNLFHFAISLLLFLLVALVIQPMPLLNLLILPALVIWETLLITGLSLLFSTLNVKYRDINFFVSAIMPLWFYATPIVYSLDLIPAKLHFLFYFNPMTALTNLFQFAFLDLAFPDLKMLVANLIISVVILFLGIVVFKAQSKFFDDWM